MKVSTKGRYGLRALVDLACNSSTQAVALSAIAARQNLSPNYLEQVFTALRKAGIVKSVKGSGGGYLLRIPAEELSVEQILNVLEGPFAIIEDEVPKSERDPVQQAVYALVWDRINESIRKYLRTTMLSDLAEKYRKLNEQAGDFYCI